MNRSIWGSLRLSEGCPKPYLWHGQKVHLVIKPSYRKGTIRNCLIMIDETKDFIVVPMRALRLLRKGG